MLPISRVLVPVDFSERCLEMMPYVKVIAHRYKAEVILLHVVDPVYVVQQIHRRLCEGHIEAVPKIEVSSPVPVPQWILAEKVKRLEGFAASELQGISVRRLVHDGDPEAQIVAVSHAENTQLIIMPTRGYGVLRRYLIGSVTAKVLHDVRCPVLTGVHLEAEPRSMNPTLSNIVCALDLRQCSEETLGWASKFASDIQGSLSIVHVVSAGSYNFHWSSSKAARELEDMARKKIERLEMTTGVKNVNICIQEGDIAQKVCSFAQSVGADLLVIGRGVEVCETGRLRTNAYAIIREAHSPVLSV